MRQPRLLLRFTAAAIVFSFFLFFLQMYEKFRGEGGPCAVLVTLSCIPSFSPQLVWPTGEAMATTGVFGAVWHLRPGAASLVAHILLNSFASPLLQLAKVSTSREPNGLDNSPSNALSLLLLN